MILLLLLVVSAYTAWQYSKSEIDPDLALFNMAAFTGSWYGRDFADCKPPAIHLWFYGLAKIVGTDIKRVRFAHHFIVGSGGILVAYLTGSFWNGLAFTVFVNSAWNYAFHGNVGQVPAIGMAVAIAVQNPVIGVLSLGLACAFEPKLLLSAAALVLFKGQDWILASVIAGLLALAAWFALPGSWRKWTWEGSFTVPKLMGRQRVEKKLYGWVPWFTAEAMLYALPWLFVAVMSKPDWMYWTPAFLYLIMCGYSKALRQNHMIPLVAWIACAGMPWVAVAALASWEWITSGFYIGDIWMRHYGALWKDNVAVHEIGEYLRTQEGTLWVNDYHPGIYIYSGKGCPWGLTEQAEMNTILTERREKMKAMLAERPADLVVIGKKCGARISLMDYKMIAKHKGGNYEVYRHIDRHYDTVSCGIVGDDRNYRVSQ